MVDVLSLTFDGLNANESAMKQLGAELNPLKSNFRPFIHHPVTEEKVFLIVNVCHMMKLLRNLWKKYGTLFIEDENGGKKVSVSNAHSYIIDLKTWIVNLPFTFYL